VNEPRRTRIKFCGLTTAREIALAVEAGADAVGIIVAPSSRQVGLDRLPELAAAVPAFVSKIGVLVNQDESVTSTLRALGFTLQFSGDESPAECERLAGGSTYLKAFHVDPRAEGSVEAEWRRAYVNAMWMFDSRVDARYGGTGVPFLWHTVAATAARRPIVVSGGLTPENVAACVRAIRPHAVDVRSGIETANRKDAEKMFAFVRAVREADSLPSEIAQHAAPK
jgi:phosphoribosylanthranilate isomerase